MLRSNTDVDSIVADVSNIYIVIYKFLAQFEITRVCTIMKYFPPKNYIYMNLFWFENMLNNNTHARPIKER